MVLRACSYGELVVGELAVEVGAVQEFFVGAGGGDVAPVPQPYKSWCPGSPGRTEPGR